MRSAWTRTVWMTAALAAGLVAGRARAVWTGAVSVTQNYNLLSNWAGGVIDDDISGQAFNGPTFQLTADRNTTGNGLDVDGNGFDGDVHITSSSNLSNPNWTLSGLGSPTLYLAGDFFYGRPGHGSTTIANTLTIDLLGGVRTFDSLPVGPGGEGGDTMTISAPITNGGLIIRHINNNSFTLDGSAKTYTGPTTLLEGNLIVTTSLATSEIYANAGTFQLSGTGGTALNADVYLRGGGVTLGTTSGANNDRLGDGKTVYLQSAGTLTLQGVNSGLTTETISARLNGFAGLNAIAGTSGTAILTVNNDRSDRGIVQIAGANQGSQRILFTDAPVLLGGGGGPATTNISIVPYAFGGTGAITTTGFGDTLTFATYDNSTGFRLLDVATEINTPTITAGTATLSGINPDENVRFRAINGDADKLNIGTGGNGLTLRGSSTGDLGRIELGGNNNYTGPTTIAYGKVSTLSAERIPDGSVVSILRSGTLSLGGAETIAGLQGIGSMAVNAQTLTLDNASGAYDFAGVISGAGGNLVKNGGYTQVLSGNNTYTGTTAVNAGELHIAGNPTGQGTTTVNGGTLRVSGAPANQGSYTIGAAGTLAGTGTIGLAGGQQVNLNGTVSPGNSVGTLTIAGGDLILGSAFTFEWEIGDDGMYDQVVVSGGAVIFPLGATPTLTLSNAFGVVNPTDQIVLFDGTGLVQNLPPASSWTFVHGPRFDTSGALFLAGDGTDVILTGIVAMPIPEPSTLALLGLSVVFLRSIRRRRR